MANRDQILNVMTTLSNAYPDKRHDKNTLGIYLEHLADIPGGLLEQAAHRHIQNSNWFPRIAQLREAAAQLSGTHDFTSLAPIHEDNLALKAAALEREFYLRGKMDLTSWEKLERGFKLAGRDHRAAYTRQKLRRLQQIAESGQTVISNVV
jgi:hypothetical protein